MLYTISNEDLKIEISDHGAEIKRIQYHDEDYLHDSNPKFWSYSAPLLWPNIGMLKNNQTIFDGKAYPLKKHGLARISDFNLVKQEKDHLVFVLKSNPEIKKMYPFDFELLVSYKLNKNSIESSIEVKNIDQKDLPFNLGLHPAFKVPHHDDEKFEDFVIEFNKSGTYEMPIVDLETGLIDYTKRNREFVNLKELPLNYHDYDNDALVFENIQADSVILKHKEKNYGVKFDFKDFPHLGIWTPNNNKFANFICLEPWIGCADRPQSDGKFLSKRDLIILKPNEKKIVNYQLTFF